MSRTMMRPAVATGVAAAFTCLAAACADRNAGVRQPSTTDDQPSTVSTSPRWEGIYQYHAERPTFRPCEHALAFPLQGSDSLLQFLVARVDLQSPRPTTRLFVELGGDTTRPDPQLPPVIAMTSLAGTRSPGPGECVAQRPAAAPPARPGELRAAVGREAPGARAADWQGSSAYLDGDELGDAIVLFTAGSSCSPAGCDLLAFRFDGASYRLVSRTARVKPPVAVRESRSDGFRELLVGVGQGGGFPDRDARLRYRAGRGYPADAAVEPPAVRDPNALELIGGRMEEGGGRRP